MKRALSWWGVLCVVPSLCAQDDGSRFFEEEVRPLLAAKCQSCHNDTVASGGLAMTSRESLLRGGSRGPSLVPGSPSDSVLIAAVKQSGALKMPPTGALPASEVDALRAWVQGGAAWGRPAGDPQASEALWSFKPVVRHEPPQVRNAAWGRNPIDAFILSRLEQEALKPSPAADRRTLIRRTTLDLTGLLPTPEEVRSFLEDNQPGAYGRLVERLLESPHYGERWGRHWLDIARYADTNGYSIDGPRSIWPYRDWVINAFNENLSFDQFVIEQVAGDLLPDPTRDQLIATGFHRNTMINQEGGTDFEQYRVEAVVDRVRTTGAAFLGLTLGCARCHDHKFDPISQREFYQIFAFFNNIDEIGGNLEEREGRRRMMDPILELAEPAALAERDSVRSELGRLEGELEDLSSSLEATWSERFPPGEMEDIERARDIIALAPEDRSSVQDSVLQRVFASRVPEFKAKQKEIGELSKKLPKIPWTMVMRDLPEPRDAYLHVQGDFTRRGDAIEPGTLRVLPAMRPDLPRNRLGLARWLVADDNPLTPRVTMNRLWQRYFGIGIVETENDFGTQGNPPSHPKLLDWLASEFVRSGWDLKQMHRLILHSATYRQASAHRADAAAVDPGNRLLARQNRLRLEAEIIRDAALSASGLLAPAVGGPSVYPPQPAGAGQFTQVDRNWKADEGQSRFRRGMYTYFIRSAAHPGLILFDAPIAQESVTRRNRSNTPLQALTLLNDESQTEFASALATRIREYSDDREERIRRAFEICLARQPRAPETERLAGFLSHMTDAFATDAEALRKTGADTASGAAWTAAARVMLNLDEFVTRQ
ncbi:MAG: PSD1 and planctomycete cytochrome C domain-containing protein [Bryobacterales bacterium]|nr:PSD1 and planctomycete cytochrome C domain-containing protein [Bryobacterales bacterium]MDE0622681.1 PSD1 and planctomycete cytochrome C domain-containing protein [Bryobacterales bacterium]